MGLIDKKEKETETTADNAEETKEVAVKSDTSLSTQTNKVSAFITAPEFVESVKDAEWGTFPSITANNGNHTLGEEELGKTIKFQAIMVRVCHKMSPGDDSEAAKEHFAVAETAEELEEAKEEAIAAGYPNARIKKYVDVFCLIVDCELEEYIGEILTIQLAPSSQYSWKPLAGKCKSASLRGRLKTQPVDGDAESYGEAVVFTSVATGAKTKAGKNYTKFVFSI